LQHNIHIIPYNTIAVNTGVKLVVLLLLSPITLTAVVKTIIERRKEQSPEREE
jgi:hypothetical protein